MRAAAVKGAGWVVALRHIEGAVPREQQTADREEHGDRDIPAVSQTESALIRLERWNEWLCGGKSGFGAATHASAMAASSASVCGTHPLTRHLLDICGSRQIRGGQCLRHQSLSYVAAVSCSCRPQGVVV